MDVMKIFILLIFIIIPSYVFSYDEVIKVTVLPFYDLRGGTLNDEVSEIIKMELLKDPVIRIVSYRINEKIYNKFEPLYMWGQSEDGNKKGGIIWSINPVIIREIVNDPEVNYTIYGKIFEYEGKTYLSACIKDMGREYTRSFNKTATSDNISKILSDIGNEIKIWLRNRYIIYLAETELRKLKGGILTYEHTIAKIKSYLEEFPDNIRLRTLLLEIYLYRKDSYKPEIFIESSKIIDLYTPSDSESTRYLLSRQIDPFDILADIYEKEGGLERAIEIRERALTVFPFNRERHEERLGMDYYLKASELRQKRNPAHIKEYLLKAREYINQGSDLYKKIEIELQKIQQGMN